MTELSETLIAEADFGSQDLPMSGLRCDRMASCGNELLIFSVIVEPQKAKALFGTLWTDKKSKLTIHGVPVRHHGWNGFEVRQDSRLIGETSESGYIMKSSKLSYGLGHFIYIAKRNGLLKTGSDQELWAELKGEKYTTPLLPEWLPYLRTAMTNEGYLSNARTFQCDGCAVVNMTDEQLDTIVSRGLQTGKISIPEKQ